MMTLSWLTGPSPVVSPKTKSGREKEPYSDDESDKLNNNGGKVEDPLIFLVLFKGSLSL
jgi:hypothetical protein